MLMPSRWARRISPYWNTVSILCLRFQFCPGDGPHWNEGSKGGSRLDADFRLGGGSVLDADYHCDNFLWSLSISSLTRPWAYTCFAAILVVAAVATGWWLQPVSVPITPEVFDQITDDMTLDDLRAWLGEPYGVRKNDQDEYE